MIVILKLIFFLSIWILGLTIVTQPNMLLHNWRVWAENKKDEGWGIMENIILCHWCMSSLHWVFAYSIAIGMGVIVEFEWRLVAMLPIVIMGSSIICGIIWVAYQFLSSITEYFKSINEQSEGNSAN